IIVIGICRRDKPPVLLWIQRMLAHEPTDLLGVHDNATMTEFGVNTPIAIGFEFVTNRLHLRNDSQIARMNVGYVVKRRATNPHQPASFWDGDAAGPAMTDVFAFLGRGAFFRAHFRNSISSACRPTIRSNAAILASYSWRRSAAWASSSKAPASYF